MTDFVRPGVVDHVHDGDTVITRIDLGGHAAHRRALLDLGWHIYATPDGHLWLKQAVRVDGLASPEISTPEGRAARDYAAGLLPPGTIVRVVSKKLLGSTEKYGRILADLGYSPDPARPSVVGSFATAMIAAGHGKPWDGTGLQPR